MIWLQKEETVFSKDTIESSKNMDDVLGNLYRNFTEGSEYFTNLTIIFQKEYKNTKNAHLENFFVIVPSLILNFVEYLRNCKDKFIKRGQEQGIFTDDGFVIGIAFLLKVLDQYTSFDSLHWFESINEYYNSQKKNYDVKIKG